MMTCLTKLNRTVHISNVDKSNAAYRSKKEQNYLATFLAILFYGNMSLLSLKNWQKVVPAI